MIALTTLTTDEPADISDALAGAGESFAAVGHADAEIMAMVRLLEGGTPGDPYTIFISPRGQVIKVHSGKATKEQFIEAARAAR